MQIGPFIFKPGLLPSLVTLVLLVLLTSLGFWQLDRAEQKRALLSDYRKGEGAVSIPIVGKIEFTEGLKYQMASLKGRYETHRQILLDNRTSNGMAGYHVVTPLRLKDGAGILVNRGWIGIGESRDVLPDIVVDDQFRDIQGRLKPIAEKVFRLGEELPREQWPYRIQHINIESISQELGYSLIPFVVLLSSDQSDGFVRDWKPLTFGPERNQGYAVQWFGLAVALLFIYIIVNTSRENN
ncbi:MAG: SURF1 family protein [Gammaproteobacteria bacterium]